jgi:2-oxoisovalerate dehydrogenase E2 component (dihydrolipoyl transacylase)
MFELKLHDIGEGMHEGEIVKLLVKVGDLIEKDQPIVEVQTDKVTAELTSPVSGGISQILCAEGEVAKVGSTLVVIDSAESEVAVAAHIVSFEQEKPALENQQSAQTALRVIATPHVRRLARQLGIDIEKVIGTGPIGRVTEEDLKNFGKEEKQNPKILHNQKAVSPTVSLPQAGGLREERIPIRGIRKKIAEHMVKSVSIIPHVTHVDEMEMEALRALRERLKPFAEEKRIKLTFLPFFVKAIVIALKEFKTFNASIDDEKEEIVLKNYYNIGIAIDTKEGLLVPVIKDADQKSILQIAEEITQLSELARMGKLTVDQMTGGTFTISNVGPIGGKYASPIINHPEVAILALHKMEQRMVVRYGEGVIRWMMNMSLSFDHRLIDGVSSVKFTNRVIQLLENIDILLMEM